ncbi:hypothetical protein EN809_025230 [Mesorhizobium sp. M2E.F.Ca.ET.166.01.1.1]|nr:hypothetical protein EN862_022950 [Mesorhizobium sp. M2E.F.Ca.ET.219.01.1.1]TGT69619.1 hypothetical protein EN809_025230 [Mesorhizobium sp. M2E.F.Ca.ET.166.01.1.1]TGW01950.1 hypothetical protein EN797_016720 [Mesorhizobium sp. M2E.F.Ca.ET.154.01.1.1]
MRQYVGDHGAASNGCRRMDRPLVHVAAKLGIADILESGPKTPHEIATTTGSHPEALHRLLRTLASLGIFAEDEEGRFGLTAIADELRSQAPVARKCFGAPGAISTMPCKPVRRPSPMFLAIDCTTTSMHTRWQRPFSRGDHGPRTPGEAVVDANDCWPERS